MIAFSAWYRVHTGEDGQDEWYFPVHLPGWDVLVIVLFVFLTTYVHNDPKSNYHRGSVFVLSYCVLVANFCLAPKEHTASATGTQIRSLSGRSLSRPA
ncbi:unnamed protein product [Peniophora sp. CBMAI 1063]|nr:unnamed protein product [Peniophora sp. CBMAI 1063]